MKQTFMQTEINKLIKRFHTLLGKNGIGQQGKEAILAGYEVESTKDLTAAQLLEACDALSNQLSPELKKLDTQRKKLMAAIGAYFRACGSEPTDSLIKATACRAASATDFNKIPVEQLRRITNLFTTKTKELKAVNEISNETKLMTFNCN